MLQERMKMIMTIIPKNDQDSLLFFFSDCISSHRSNSKQ